MDESKKIVLLDFWAEWCAPCKRLSLIVDRVVSDFDGMVELEKINVEDDTQSVEQYGVSHLPTLILISGGIELSRRSGAMTKEALKIWIENNIK